MKRNRLILIIGIIIVVIGTIVGIYIVLGNRPDETVISDIDENNSLDTAEDALVAFPQNEVAEESPYIIPNSLLYRLNIDAENSNKRYYYSYPAKVAFTYEVKSIDGKSNVMVTEEDPRINTQLMYVFIEGEEIKSGQSIEVINVRETLRFNDISTIIREQILTADQKQNCEIEENNGKYSIIARDKTVKDSTTVCGNYAKGKNRFFLKPQESGTAINKLVFVSAGDRELSYDGSGKGKYWYESVIVE